MKQKSLFPEVDREITELNNRFESFKRKLLEEHKQYICFNSDEAQEFEDDVCKNCTKYRVDKNNIPSCDIIIEFIAIGETSKIIDRDGIPWCLEDSGLKEAWLKYPLLLNSGDNTSSLKVL